VWFGEGPFGWRLCSNILEREPQLGLEEGARLVHDPVEVDHCADAVGTECREARFSLPRGRAIGRLTNKPVLITAAVPRALVWFWKNDGFGRQSRH